MDAGKPVGADSVCARAASCQCAHFRTQGVRAVKHRIGGCRRGLGSHGEARCVFRAWGCLYRCAAGASDVLVCSMPRRVACAMCAAGVASGAVLLRVACPTWRPPGGPRFVTAWRAGNLKRRRVTYSTCRWSVSCFVAARRASVSEPNSGPPRGFGEQRFVQASKQEERCLAAFLRRLRGFSLPSVLACLRSAVSVGATASGSPACACGGPKVRAAVAPACARCVLGANHRLQGPVPRTRVQFHRLSLYGRPAVCLPASFAGSRLVSVWL